MANEDESESELFMESAHDRDLDNDGIPDICYDKTKGGLVFKNKEVKAIYERYVSYDARGRNPQLSIGAVLVDVVKELKRIRRILDKR